MDPTQRIGYNTFDNLNKSTLMSILLHIIVLFLSCFKGLETL